jgi:hypothetical protein
LLLALQDSTSEEQAAILSRLTPDEQKAFLYQFLTIPSLVPSHAPRRGGSHRGIPCAGLPPLTCGTESHGSKCSPTQNFSAFVWNPAYRSTQ